VATHPTPRASASGRAGPLVLLVASLAVAAALTLTPDGTGWAWGGPVSELRWYLTGLDSASTVAQLVGNLGLLVVPAVALVGLEPRLGRFGPLAAVALAAGAGIEVLQWALPLGRVVSPLDALLNAAGAVVAGLLAARVPRSRRAAAPTVSARPPAARPPAGVS
jgi:hypothetical protein